MNRWGTLQPEFIRPSTGNSAVIGTDCIIWVDGRWSETRARDYIQDTAYAYAAAHNLDWQRSVYLLGGRHRTVTV